MPISCSVWTGEGGNEALNKKGKLKGDNVTLEVNEKETLANETQHGKVQKLHCVKGANLLLHETPRCTEFSDFMNPDGETLAWLDLLGMMVHQNHDFSVRLPLLLLVTPHAACAAVLQV